MEYITITSAQNAALKHLVKLRDRRTRDKENLTILEGYRELTRSREYGMELVECYFSPEHFLGSNEFPLLEEIAASGVKVTRLAPHLLEKVTYRDRPEGLLAVAKMRKHELSQLPEFDAPLYLVAETIEKPGNLGSMLRSADAVNADGVIICNRQTDVLNPNVIRASTGAIYYVPVAETSSEECVEWLRKHNITSIAASPHSTDVYTDYDMTKGIAIVVGAEQYGLTDYWMNSADVNVQIPMLGKMDSLNVATAATILLYEAARQRGFKKG